MKAYKLLKDIPGLPAGTVFLHDKKDHVRGNISHGCLKNAWNYGNCQGNAYIGHWCANTHVFPGQLAYDRKWFKPVTNIKVKRYGKKTRWYTL